MGKKIFVPEKKEKYKLYLFSFLFLLLPIIFMVRDVNAKTVVFFVFSLIAVIILYVFLRLVMKDRIEVDSVGITKKSLFGIQQIDWCDIQEIQTIVSPDSVEYKILTNDAHNQMSFSPFFEERELLEDIIRNHSINAAKIKFIGD